MSQCRQIESLLPSFVDGEADAASARVVGEHLARCAACRVQVDAERAVRTVLRARRSELKTMAPAGLRTRVITAALEDLHRSQHGIGWRGRVSAFGLAAAAVLAVTIGLELVTPRSNVLYAAQLAIDHMRCFVVERSATDDRASRDLQWKLATDYGWSVVVPPSNQEAGVILVAARRCPYWLGDHAHLLYRAGTHQVSLYVTPDAQTRDADLHILGHAAKLWTSGGHVYALIANGLPAPDLERIAAYLQRQTLQ